MVAASNKKAADSRSIRRFIRRWVMFARYNDFMLCPPA